MAVLKESNNGLDSQPAENQSGLDGTMDAVFSENNFTIQ